MQSITRALRQSQLARSLAAGAVMLALAATSAPAADYFVFGRVYSATPLAAGDEMPIHPLTGIPADQILGEDLVPQVPRNLVNVKLIRASDGGELGSYVARKDGGYLISFTDPAASLSARLVVEELATSKILFDGPTVTLGPWPATNIKFILVPEELAEITGDRDFATNVSPPQYTGIFTRVGKIEIQTEDPPGSGTQKRLIDYTTGEATVSPLVSGDLAIPRYLKAAFGGNLYLFGAFSQDLYSLGSDICYKIAIEDVDAGTTADFTDSLVKTKYTVNFSTGTVDTERITLGPKTIPAIGGTPNCYELTPLAAGNNQFWSFPDLLGLWRTGTRDGRYRVRLSVHNMPAGSVFQAISMFTDITLRVDNTPVTARIQPLVDTSPAGPDTPRVYTHTSGALPGTDLVGTLKATYPGDYSSGDPTCAIFNVEPPGDKFIAFRLTAHKANGFLRSWSFGFERNDKRNQTLIGKVYDGTATMANLTDASINSSQTSTSGFQNMFLYVDRAHLDKSGGPVLGSCAYRFVIRAARRVTDGYHYLSSSGDQDLHYVQK